jgi:hypothetical protein
LVGVWRVLRSAASRRRRVGVRAGQQGPARQGEAAELMSWKRKSIEHRQLQRRTAPACHPNIECPIVQHHPLHCIALHCRHRSLPRRKYYTSPPRRTAASLAAAHCPPPPSSELLPSPSRLRLPRRPRSLPEAYTRPACNRPMLRHNHTTLLTSPAAPLATGIGFGHAACPAT